MSIDENLAIKLSRESLILKGSFKDCSINGDKIITSSFDGIIRIFNSITGECIKSFNEPGLGVIGGILCNDDLTIAFVSDYEIQLVNTIDGKCYKLIKFGSRIISCDISIDGLRIVTSNIDETVRLFCAVTGELIKIYSNDYGSVVSNKFLTCNSEIILCCNDTIRIRNFLTNLYSDFVFDANNTISDFDISQNKRIIAIIHYSNIIKIYDFNSKRLITSFKDDCAYYLFCLFYRDETLIVSAGSDYNVKIWDIPTSKCIKTLTGHTSSIHSLEISQDSSQIVSGSKNEIIIWNYPLGIG